MEDHYNIAPWVSSGPLIWLVPILLQVLLKLFSFPVSNFNRADSGIVGFLEFDGPISDVFSLDPISVQHQNNR